LDPFLFDRWGPGKGHPGVTGIGAHQAPIDCCVLGVLKQRLTVTSTQRSSGADPKIRADETMLP